MRADRRSGCLSHSAVPSDATNAEYM
jgi:hypothetical protein